MELLKLFVVGEKSPCPDNWSPWNDRAIVIAHDAAEAIELAGLDGADVAEIPLANEALVLAFRNGDIGDES
jgi:hypothetical protein